MTHLRELINEFEDFSLDGNNLALDFINTVDWRFSDHPLELIPGYDQFLAWCVRVDILDANEAMHLSAEAKGAGSGDGLAEDPASRVRRCRDDLAGVFASVATREEPPGDRIRRLNEWHRELGRFARIVLSDGAFALRYQPDGLQSSSEILLWPLAPIVRAAVDLLLEGDPGRIRTCGNPECGWFFYDTSKNGSRRWCSMASCGNREKARNHYRRSRSGGDPGGRDSGKGSGA